VWVATSRPDLKNTEPKAEPNMNNRRFVTYIVSIPVVAGLLLALVADASAAPMAPQSRHDAAGWAPAAPGALPRQVSAQRARMAAYRVPGACVVITEFRADGSIHRMSRCEYSPTLRARLASTGK